MRDLKYSNENGKLCRVSVYKLACLFLILGQMVYKAKGRSNITLFYRWGYYRLKIICYINLNSSTLIKIRVGMH